MTYIVSTLLEAFLSFYEDLKDFGTLTRFQGNLVFFSHDAFQMKTFSLLKDPVYFLQQVHGDTIVRCQSKSERADGQWTDHRKQVLVIKTADCLPVFIADQRRIMGLHLGWRAFTNSLFSKALTYFNAPEKTKIIIGPHIGYDSFQVDRNTAKAILSSQNISFARARNQNLIRPSVSQNNHWHIHLCELLVLQAKKMGYKNLQIHNIDTFSSPIHFSHRRNRWRQGTNYSFIVKL